MDAENSQLEVMLAGHGPRGRTILLEVLHDAQEICGGWLPRPAIERIAEFLEIPVADVYGVTQFYEMFHTEPVGRRVIRVCQDGPCAVAGAAKLTEERAARRGIRPRATRWHSPPTGAARCTWPRPTATVCWCWTSAGPTCAPWVASVRRVAPSVAWPRSPAGRAVGW